MSSNMSIQKICNQCKKRFIAKTTVTKYCSLDCGRKGNKENNRREKIEKAQVLEYEKSVGIDMKLIQSKEFLSIKEACLLIGVSRMTLHRYITNKALTTLRLGGKVIIKRQALNNLIR